MTEPLSEERLREIERIHAASTKGVWVSLWEELGVIYSVHGNSMDEIACAPEHDDRHDDFEFIADAHQAIPELLAEIKRLKDLAQLNLVEIVVQQVETNRLQNELSRATAHACRIDLVRHLDKCAWCNEPRASHSDDGLCTGKDSQYFTAKRAK